MQNSKKIKPKIKYDETLAWSVFVLAFSFLFAGGLSDLLVALVGVFVSFLLIRTGVEYKGKPMELLPILAVFWGILVSFWAADYVYNLLGLLRIVAVLLWAALLSKLPDMADKMLQLLPVYGALGVVYSFVFQRFSGGRMAGPFLYANTWGIFLAICIVIGIHRLEQKSGKLWMELAVLGVNLLGFVLTGSRSSVLLLMVWGIYKMLTNKKLRPYLLGGMLMFIVLAAVAYFGFGKTQTIGRVFTLTNVATTKTVAERLQYYKDGFKCLMAHPLGMGYMGYSYLQGGFQETLYATTYVHNDWLQSGLDYGIPAMIAWAVYFCYQIFVAKQGVLRKELLVMLLGGSMVDFHLQYLFMGLVLILFLKLPEAKKQEKVVWKARALPIGAAVLMGYLCLPFGADNLVHNYDRALELWPGYTLAQEHRLEQMDDYEVILNLTEKLLAKNPNNSKAWTAKAVLCELTGDMEGMCDAMEHSISLAHLQQEIYVEYMRTIEDLLPTCRDEDQELLLEKYNWMQQELNALQKNN